MTTYLPMLLGDQVFIREALYDPASQNLSVKAASSDQVVQHALTVQGLGTIDSGTGQLVVTQLVAPPAKVTVLSSGSGSNELQVITGTVAGGEETLPVAVNDAATTLEDTATTISVLATDTGVAGGTGSAPDPSPGLPGCA